MLDLIRKQSKEKTVPEIGLPAGVTMDYAGTTAPAGWLECDGSAVSRTTYADLFANIGTKYGIGDGSTTFNLPDGPRRTVEVDLDVTYSQDDGSVNEISKGYAYQDALGRWYLKFNLFMENGSTATTPTATIAGIDFLDTKSFNVSVLAASQTTTARAYCTTTTGQIQIQFEISTTFFAVGGNIPLDSKPTDAFVGADSRFSTFDEALESIPMIKI